MSDTRLGKAATDDILKIVGTITVVAHYLDGTTRVCIEYVDQCGQQQNHWVDQARITLAH